jgi:riboflavin kinase/FMN adenylyltransferase
VYAGRTVIEGRTFPTAISVGVPPTFPQAGDLFEAHVRDFDGDLYGTILAVDLLDRIRDQRRFDTTEDLTRTIADDVVQVRAIAATT